MGFPTGYALEDKCQVSLPGKVHEEKAPSGPHALPVNLFRLVDLTNSIPYAATVQVSKAYFNWICGNVCANTRSGLCLRLT